MTNIIRSKSISDIVETGSNENGNFVKYRNGIMECWGEISLTLDINVTYGSLFRSNAISAIVYPQEFIVIPSFIINTTYSTATCWTSCVLQGTTTASPTYYLVKATTGTGVSLTLSWKATGKWSSAYDENVPTISIGRGIIESGSNEYGSWIKYEDGTLEQWGYVASYLALPTGNGNWKLITTPQHFTSKGVGQGSVQANCNVWVAISTQFSTEQPATNTIAVFNRGGYAGDTAIQWRAVGRWQSATNTVGNYTYGQGIVETGSNSNGSWIKFDNGTLIQWGTISNFNAIVINNNNIGTYGWSYYSSSYSDQPTRNLPTSFLNETYSLVSQQGTNYSFTIASPLDGSSFRMTLVSYNTSVTNIYVRWQAIGRWK